MNIEPKGWKEWCLLIVLMMPALYFGLKWECFVCRHRYDIPFLESSGVWFMVGLMVFHIIKVLPERRKMIQDWWWMVVRETRRKMRALFPFSAFGWVVFALCLMPAVGFAFKWKCLVCQQAGVGGFPWYESPFAWFVWGMMVYGVYRTGWVQKVLKWYSGFSPVGYAKLLVILSIIFLTFIWFLIDVFLLGNVDGWGK